MMDSFEVRTATAADVTLLAELDRASFGATGMEVYGEEHFRVWLDVNPSGLSRYSAPLNGRTRPVL